MVGVVIHRRAFRLRKTERSQKKIVQTHEITWSYLYQLLSLASHQPAVVPGAFMESIAASLLEGIRPLLVHAEAEGKPENFQTRLILGFGVPYFNTFFLKEPL